MKIKRYIQFISEEILNMPSWSSLSDNGKNGYVLPLLIWSSDIFEKTFKDGDYETKKPQSDVKLVKSWNLEGPDWFIENCRRVEDYMDSEGYKVTLAIKYPADLEYLDSIDELGEQQGLIYGVWFLFDEKLESLTESVDVEKEMVEDFLRDFSDEDIPVEVEMYQPDPLGSEENRVLILIGDEDNMNNMDNMVAKDLPLYQNINNFISLNEYLIDEGYRLKSIACWIKPHNDSITGQRPTTIFEFDNFISKIEEIENWNLRHPALWHKTFKLVDICYES